MAVRSERKTLLENKIFKKFKPTNHSTPFDWRIFRRTKKSLLFFSLFEIHALILSALPLDSSTAEFYQCHTLEWF